MKSDDELIADLKEATSGLLFMSESDYPFEVFKWDATTEPTPEFLRGLTGEDSGAQVEEVSAAEFFRVAVSEPEWKVGAELATARKFQTLLQVLGKNLSDLKAFRVGTINIPVYVVGRGSSGNWIGVSTRSVET